eukprot:CAMPEP_0171802440 /NCGR_PEP_ID=MMETSP0991-20121206/72843_1 /TAXON_ID=483369 /ORGANISM="non described non described, Strain CCMP2098" /LENGTH=51 /DNA_ID=CAMNT_0012414275 /DNA_START=181 /DNA_END=336 /DNA_ORIENTATION=+
MTKPPLRIHWQAHAEDAVRAEDQAVVVKQPNSCRHSTTSRSVAVVAAGVRT